VIEICEYLDSTGRSPFAKWSSALPVTAAAKVTTALERMAAGHRSNVKGDFGPGYRIYFGQDGDTLVILLAGGTKARQQRDIEQAKLRWRDYLVRKK
jgi:putative addiction module killer protein